MAPKMAFNIEVLLDLILQVVAVIKAVLGLFGIQNL
jgi:hypothetical protein